jgi:hypothetical protein
MNDLFVEPHLLERFNPGSRFKAQRTQDSAVLAIVNFIENKTAGDLE